MTKGRQEITRKCIKCLNSPTATSQNTLRAFEQFHSIHRKEAIPRLVQEVGLTSTLNALYRIDPFGCTVDVSGHLEEAFNYAQMLPVQNESQKRISESLLQLELLADELETPRHLTPKQKQIIVQEANGHAKDVLTKIEISRKNWGEVLELVHRLKKYSRKSCSVDLMLLNAARELKESVDKFILVLGDGESRKVLCRICYDILPMIRVSGLTTELDEGRLRGLQFSTSAAIDVIDLYAKLAKEREARVENA